MIRKWLDRRRAMRENEEFRTGWDWAAGRMLAGEWTELGLRNFATGRTIIEGEKPWLQGILAACAKMRTLEVTVK